MTTNARDEKWSDLIEWNGGDRPVDFDEDVYWQGRGGEELGPIMAGHLDWSHSGLCDPIIAYRYKIKEPESDMHPDLEWLATNVSEWQANMNYGAAVYGRRKSGWAFLPRPASLPWEFSFDQWLQARKDLGLIMSDEEEEMEAEEWLKRNLYDEIEEGFDSMEKSRSDGSTASYYELPPNCTELQDLISYRNLNAQDGEIFRAIYRKGRASHSDELRDARKVLFYAKAEVQRLEKKCIG